MATIKNNGLSLRETTMDKTLFLLDHKRNNHFTVQALIKEAEIGTKDMIILIIISVISRGVDRVLEHLGLVVLLDNSLWST